MINLIQSSVFPCISLCSENDLYFRSNNLVDISLNDSCIYLKSYGKLYTNTYFNSISLCKWKRYTNIKDLKFNIKFKGFIKITWHISSLEVGKRIVREDYLRSDDLRDFIIDLDFWGLYQLGMLYFEVTSFSDSIIKSFYYYTSDKPLRSVRLGIVITHFNRKFYVKGAISRINKYLLSDSYYSGKVDIFIIDNSCNLGELDKVTIIPNRNLGGAGGFTRGLINLIDRGIYTHCLFMDDDASCEIESIRRSISFIENCISLISISGAMLREVKPYEQYENGAIYRGYCVRLKKDLNLLNERNLLLNEKEEFIDYAAWWFFMFPIDQVKYFAFPYFVRGDDISFGLSNNFRITTLNGICSWQPDFSIKNSPINFYLDVRSTLMPLLNNLSSSKNLFNTLIILLFLFFRNILTYHYDSAKAIILSLKDIQLGPSYWVDNIDMVSKRKQIEGFIENERYVDIDLDNLSSKDLVMIKNTIKNKEEGSRRLPWYRRLYYLLSLNGHLIPIIFFKRGISFQYLYNGLGFVETYRYRESICINDKDNRYMVLFHSKFKFFKYSFIYIKEIIIFLIKYRKLKKIYTKSFKDLTSKGFWVNQFDFGSK